MENVIVSPGFRSLTSGEPYPDTILYRFDSIDTLFYRSIHNKGKMKKRESGGTGRVGREETISYIL